VGCWLLDDYWDRDRPHVSAQSHRYQQYRGITKVDRKSPGTNFLACEKFQPSLQTLGCGGRSGLISALGEQENINDGIDTKSAGAVRSLPAYFNGRRDRRYVSGFVANDDVAHDLVVQNFEQGR